MRIHRLIRLVSSCSVVAVLISGCGDIEPPRVEATPPRSASNQPSSPNHRASSPSSSPHEVARMLEIRARGQRERVEVLRFLVAAVEFAETAEAQVRAARGAALRPPAAVSAPSVGGEPGSPPPAPPTGDPLQPCGGDLPPCSVKRRESGGNYAAYNPRGCSGRSCGGAWQFDPRTWDGVAARAGRPDLVGVQAQNASPTDQDAMARVLWANGAGCSNWDACR